jgi:hypothetical protein
MRSPLWLSLAALLVFGCNDSPDRVTAPAVVVPNGDDVDVDEIAENLMTQGYVPARCVQVRHVSENGTKKNAAKGDCTCVTGRGRLVSVTAVIWSGAAGNNVLGNAYCRQSLGASLIAGPAVAVDPGSSLGVAALIGAVSTTGSSSCTLRSSVTNTANTSIRLVTCVWH